ncbi:hypothetical protein ACFFSY_13855 [Paenibacillus aurantiacus]|uniref:Uncharacterized protein n=1 Tax=Paenibacillus aurantiacus TaxID=1936118 RepID=A0ABV5KP52_9BACL
MSYDVYAIAGGFGVMIEKGTVRMDQTLHPFENRPMQEGEAEAFGAAVVNGDPIPFDRPEPPPFTPPVKTQQELRFEQLEADKLTLMEVVVDLYELIEEKLSSA